MSVLWRLRIAYALTDPAALVTWAAVSTFLAAVAVCAVMTPHAPVPCVPHALHGLSAVCARTGRPR